MTDAPQLCPVCTRPMKRFENPERWICPDAGNRAHNPGTGDTGKTPSANPMKGKPRPWSTKPKKK